MHYRVLSRQANCRHTLNACCVCFKNYLPFLSVDEASLHGLQGQMEENQSVQHEER